MKVQGDGCWGGGSLRKEKSGITFKRYDEEGHRGSLKSVLSGMGVTNALKS